MAKAKLTDAQLQAKLEGLCHAMQSGVAMEMEITHGPTLGPTSPKSLRVGVNTAMVDHSALAGLLIEKGIITDREYREALVAGMKEEVGRYEKLLSDRLEKPIKLG